MPLSFSIVESVSRQLYSLTLRDLENEPRILTLIDINLSHTMAGELIVFFRPIELAQFAMTSGIAFIFPVDLQAELVERWEHQGKTVDSAKRYAHFFKLSKKKGHSTAYV